MLFIARRPRTRLYKPQQYQNSNLGGRLLLKHYANILIERQITLIQFSNLLTIDTYFWKSPFMKFQFTSQNLMSFLAFKTMPLFISALEHRLVSVADHNPKNLSKQYLTLCYDGREIKVFSGFAYSKSI